MHAKRLALFKEATVFAILTAEDIFCSKLLETQGNV